MAREKKRRLRTFIVDLDCKVSGHLEIEAYDEDDAIERVNRAEFGSGIDYDDLKDWTPTHAEEAAY